MTEAPTSVPTGATPGSTHGITLDIHLQTGGRGSFRVTARASPVALLSVGVLVSAILLSVAPIIWSARRRP